MYIYMPDVVFDDMHGRLAAWRNKGTWSTAKWIPLVLRERVIPRRPMGIHRFHRGGQHMVQRSEHWKDIVINVTVHPIKVVKESSGRH